MSCGGSFPRTQFLGATISQYQGTIGWNGQQGDLTAIVINDDCVGGGIKYADNGNGGGGIATSDDFNPPELGFPVTFRYSGFRFSGILQNWNEVDSADGVKQYSVHIVDPKDIIDGTQLILNNYIGETFGLPNLVNVFGYLEHYLGAYCPEFTATVYPPFGFNVVLRYLPAAGFGGADDRGGLPWWQIRGALNDLLNSRPGANDFGSACQYRGQPYNVDLSDLPSLDDWIRFSNDSMSLGELIHEVCELTSHDYFYTLVNHDTIKVRVVDRSTQARDYSAFNVDTAVGTDVDSRLDMGSIGGAVGSATGVSDKQRGVELRHGITNSFLTGEYRQDIWQTNLMLADSASTIWPYWGKDIDGSYIDGHGVAYENNPVATEHYFDVSMAGWGIPGFTGSWRITTTELRFALEGETMWRNFALARQPGLAGAVKMIAENELPEIGTEHFDMLLSGASRPQQLASASRVQADNSNYEGEVWDRVSQIYDHILQYANNYFGKKYMVRLPYLCVKLDSSTPYTLQTNWQLAQDGGWFEGAVLGMMPGSILLEHFRQADGKIEAFVGYQTSKPLDMSGLTNSDNFVQINPYTAYVKCQVTDLIQVFPGDWRAVIEVPGLVRVADPHPTLQQILGLWAMLRVKYGVGKVADTALFDIGKQPGADKIQYQIKPLPQIPLAAAIPLQSKRLVYGPWGATIGSLGSAGPSNVGQTSYERNADFAPWNFGSVTRMNTAGDALTLSRLSNHYVVEQGSVRVADAPTVSLGDALYGSGPLVTRLETRVSSDQSAITSNYIMKTYTPEYGKLGRQFVDAVKRNGQWAQKANRMFRKWALEKQRKVNDLRATHWAGRVKANVRYSTASSSDLLIGRSVYDPKTPEGAQSIVASTEMRKALPELNGADAGIYRMTAAMDTIGLLRGFSTYEEDKDYARLPVFEESPIDVDSCESEAAYQHTLFYSKDQVPPICEQPHLPIVMETLSPFLKDENAVNGLPLSIASEGHDIEYIARDGVYPAHFSVRQGGYSDEHWYRGICLRGPLIIAGWGYDTNNKPVPNERDDYPDRAALRFKEDWLRKPHEWKCGPLDLRWDDRRKVWSAPVSHKLVRVELRGPALPGQYTRGVIQDDPIPQDCDGEDMPDDKTYIAVYNPYCRPFPPGSIAYCHWDTNVEAYFIVRGDDPLYKVIMTGNLAVGASATALVHSALGCEAADVDGKAAFVISELGQPLCEGVGIFGYWYHWIPTEYEDICGKQCVKECTYFFQPVQAQFGTFLIVTCLNFVKCDVQVSKLLPHDCTCGTSASGGGAYYGGCYCSCSVDCSSHDSTDEWKEYKLGVHARKFYVQAPPSNEKVITLPDDWPSSCDMTPEGFNCDDSHIGGAPTCSPGGGGS